MEQMETEKVVDVYGFVAQMRKQRNYMVQTEVSYACTYSVFNVRESVTIISPILPSLEEKLLYL